MSKPTSVEEIVERLFWGGMGTCKASHDPMNSGGLRALEDKLKEEAAAKINRLIVEAELKGFNIAFDCHDYDRLRAYKEQLTKELGDSEAEKNSGTWSRL